MTDFVVTAEGFGFDPRPDMWHIGTRSGPMLFNFSNLPGVAPTLRSGIKDVVCLALRTKASSTASGTLTRIRMLLRSISPCARGSVIDRITLADVDRYVQQLPTSSGYLANDLRRALQAWVEGGVAGLSQDLVEMLETIEGDPNPVGHAVKNWSPTQGALPAGEEALLANALFAAYEAGSIGLADCVICAVSLAFAPRAIEISLLKVCDLD